MQSDVPVYLSGLARQCQFTLISFDKPAVLQYFSKNGRFGELVPLNDPAAMAIAMPGSLTGLLDRKEPPKRAKAFLFAISLINM